MRLIHCRTLQLYEFTGSNIPPYAILSHRWGQAEVTFQEFSSKPQHKLGFLKIQNFCLVALEYGLEYGWVDTCCIDKSSSAELSESINSMYQWYRDAVGCIAYLADVSVRAPEPTADQLYDKLCSSEWFERGWTLQELIAPQRLDFYSREWFFLGKRRSSNILTTISIITSVSTDILTGRTSIHRESIAKRMSWASKRKTTRKEDEAYSLLGIFEVNMPLLYGEGPRAFQRLQEEIMKHSDDQSLFAWEDLCTDESAELVWDEDGPLRGPLALSPAEFANSSDIVPFRDWTASKPYAMTSHGLRCELPIHGVHCESTVCIAVLSCHHENYFGGPLGIHIRPLGLNRKSKFIGKIDSDQYARDHRYQYPVVVNPNIYFKPTIRTIFLRKEVILPRKLDQYRQHSFLVRLFANSSKFTNTYGFPLERWYRAKGDSAIIRSPSVKGGVIFEGEDGVQLAIVMRLDYDRDFEHSGRWESSRCTCKVFVAKERKWEVTMMHGFVCLKSSQNVFELYERVASHGSNKTFEDLEDGRRVVAEIRKDIIMGVQMFVVDVNIFRAEDGLYELE